MATSRQTFDNCRICYMTGGRQGPVTNCHDGPDCVGKLCFQADGAPLPPSLILGSGIIYLRFAISQFNDVIGILRSALTKFRAAGPCRGAAARPSA